MLRKDNGAQRCRGGNTLGGAGGTDVVRCSRERPLTCKTTNKGVRGWGQKECTKKESMRGCLRYQQDMHQRRMTSRDLCQKHRRSVPCNDATYLHS